MVITLSLSKQTLVLARDSSPLLSFSISSAKNGSGNLNNSGCTPLGKHFVKLKIGHQCPENTVFIGRRATGEIYSDQLAKSFPERDWILSRILWLKGLEPDKNLGHGVDTFKRYIYIHGTPDTEPMGTPQSCGCIRMRNKDIITLFKHVQNGTPVTINP